MNKLLFSLSALMLTACATSSPEPGTLSAGNANVEPVPEESVLVVEADYEEGEVDPVCLREKLRPLSRISVERCYDPAVLNTETASAAEREIMLRDIEIMRQRQIARDQAQQAARAQAIYQTLQGGGR